MVNYSVNKFFCQVFSLLSLRHFVYSLAGKLSIYIESPNYNNIISNSNRSKNGRLYLLNELFPQNEYVRILVHFEIPDDVLYERVARSTRSTNIFRGSYSSFKEVLNRQQAESLHEDVVDPIENEADYLFVIRNNKDVNFTIEEIVHLAKDLSPTPK